MEQTEDKMKKKSAAALAKDPFLVFGPGLQNFMKLSSRMTGLFFVLALLAIIQAAIFTNFSDDHTYPNSNFLLTPRQSFGNLGFPKEVCSKAPLVWNEKAQKNGVPFLFDCP